MAKSTNNRTDGYEKKLKLDKTVEFDDLFKVAINHNPKKKVTPAKKKKK